MIVVDFDSKSTGVTVVRRTKQRAGLEGQRTGGETKNVGWQTKRTGLEGKRAGWKT